MSRGKVVQAIVSVMAVNIQFNSPKGVRRSFKSPGSWMTVSVEIPLGSGLFIMK